MRITAEQLSALGAYCNQVEIFRAEWPNGAEVTLANCLRAAVLNLNFDWAAAELLSAPAQTAYREATAPAWRAYREATAPAERAYREATAPAERAYQEATAPAEKAHQEAKAAAFFEAATREARP